ncbi:MAG TPA: ABC transporter ATP-binding protein [Methylomirabilota bacterium]|nr:ABC transporter ATP-binding protein [Methylomirabilota bacterium]
MTARAPAVEIRAASKEFGAGAAQFRALDAVSLSIRANEFFTLLGPSGCGKTTLLRMIAGFEAPTRGMILLDGEDITDRPPFHRPVNTVFQNYALFPHMSVAENIGFGLTMLGRRKSEVAATVAEMLRLVRMEDLAGRRTSQISGGQQQRVALARALAPRPKVLLLDEPLSALDLKLRKEMQIELKRLQHETGITFIFVTHDQEEALTMSDRIAVMSKGRVLQVGGPRDIYHAPVDRFVAGFIGETNMLPATIERIDGATARARLAIGPALTASVSDDIDDDGDVVVMLRPEHARLVEAGAADAALTGTLAEIVYFGTDTHFHIRLADGSTFIVREQNRAGVDEVHAAGAAVGIAVDAGAARILHP